VGLAFHLSFLNKCETAERAVVSEYYQRCFNMALPSIESLGMANPHEQ
jgi:cobaltochelatase CobS